MHVRSAVCAALLAAGIGDSYAPDGTLLEEIRHISFAGTLANDVTGASIAYEGRFTRTHDAVANTITITITATGWVGLR